MIHLDNLPKPTRKKESVPSSEASTSSCLHSYGSYKAPKPRPLNRKEIDPREIADLLPIPEDHEKKHRTAKKSRPFRAGEKVRRENERRDEERRAGHRKLGRELFMSQDI